VGSGVNGIWIGDGACSGLGLLVIKVRQQKAGPSSLEGKELGPPDVKLQASRQPSSTPHCDKPLQQLLLYNPPAGPVRQTIWNRDLTLLNYGMIFSHSKL